MRRVIQGVSAPKDLVTQLWPRTPQQRRGAGDVRRRHRRAAKADIGVIGGVIAGTSICARRANIGLNPITSVDCYRAAAAKRRDVVGAGVQCSDRVREIVNSWRIHHCRTVRTIIASARHHHDAGSSLRFYRSLQRGCRTTFRRRTDPGVTRNIWSSYWVALAAAYRIWCQKPFHALDVSRRRAVTLVHIAATDPLCTGCHPNLVTGSVVTSGGPDRVSAVPVIVAGERRIVAARVAHTIVNGIVPIVIVIGSDSVPAAIVRFERVMRPTNARVSAGHGNPLPSKAQRPYVRCTCVSNTRFDRRRPLRFP